jgi:hypothetical protein
MARREKRERSLGEVLFDLWFLVICLRMLFLLYEFCLIHPALWKAFLSKLLYYFSKIWGFLK